MLLVTKITGIVGDSEEIAVDINDPTLLEAVSESTVEIEGEVSGISDLVGEVGSHNEINIEIIASGPKGQDGFDAYEMWLSKGNVGTIDDFFNSLKGADGLNYIHPDTHSAEMILETEEKNFMSLSEKNKALTTYVHIQDGASNVWTIVHNLDKYPSVDVVDSGGTIVMGTIEYLTKNEVQLIFTSQFSGRAYLN